MPFVIYIIYLQQILQKSRTRLAEATSPWKKNTLRWNHRQPSFLFFPSLICFEGVSDHSEHSILLMEQHWCTHTEKGKRGWILSMCMYRISWPLYAKRELENQSDYKKTKTLVKLLFCFAFFFCIFVFNNNLQYNYALFFHQDRKKYFFFT